MLTWGWQTVARLWAFLLLVMAALCWVSTTEDPEQASRRLSGIPPKPLTKQIQPLRRLQVWRFSLYYFVTFGGYIVSLR